MADDKIKISWDELDSTRVDKEIKHQQMLKRAQEHQQHVAAVPPPLPSADNKQSIMYNTMLYMAFFGLIGGILAWGFGEITWKFYQSDAFECGQKFRMLQRQLQTGEISETQYREIGQELAIKNKYWKILMDDSLSDSARTDRITKLQKHDERINKICNLLFYCICGIFLAIFLSIAEPAISRNWRQVFINASIASLVGLLGGVILSLFIDNVYQWLGGGQSYGMGIQMFARAAAWAILGLFLAIAPGLILKSFKKVKAGIIGGLVGGLVGGLLFDPIGALTGSGTISRLVQLLAIGATAGIGIGLIENTLKTGWLKVTAGLIAGKQFIIYRDPTRIGSSPECEIYLFKDQSVAPVHASIRTVPGGFVLEDSGMSSGTYVNGSAVNTRKLASGDQLRIGGTTFVFQEKPKE